MKATKDRLRERTEEVLAEFGFSTDEIASLGQGKSGVSGASKRKKHRNRGFFDNSKWSKSVFRDNRCRIELVIDAGAEDVVTEADIRLIGRSGEVGL
jgi:hypothetical protein